MARITNEVSIRAKVVNEVKKEQYVNFMRRAVETRVLFAKEEMLRDLDSHQVTKELLDSPSSYGQSQLLTRGNLVTYLGLPDGAYAYWTLREHIRQNTELNESPPDISANSKRIFYTFKIDAPSLREIYEDKQFESPDKWTSRSWVQVIEDGFSGAASNVLHYFFSTKELGNTSRSGFGIQLKGKKTKNPASFTPMKYVSEILNKFRGKFR